MASLRYRSISNEVNGEACKSSVLWSALSAEHSAADASFYVLLRAADRFYASTGRYPGAKDGDVEDDVPLLKSMANQVRGRVVWRLWEGGGVC